MFLKVVSPVLAILCIAGASYASGPFGLDMGMTIEQISSNAVEVTPGKYRLPTVPKPHSAFEYYLVQVCQNTGLAWIKAVGNDIRTSSYGIELRSAYDDMEEKLTKVYGAGKRTDALLPGSIWDELDDWMMSLVQKERYLMTIWDVDSGATLKNNIAMLGLVASATSSGEGYISLEYYFANNDECDKELAAEEDSGL